MNKVFFHASEVAALLGRHRYKIREQALLEALDHQKGQSFHKIKNDMWADPIVRKRLEEISKKKYSQTLPSVIHQATLEPSKDTTDDGGVVYLGKIREDARKQELQTIEDLIDTQTRYTELQASTMGTQAAEEVQTRLRKQAECQITKSKEDKHAAKLLVKLEKRETRCGSVVGFKAVARRLKTYFALERLKAESTKHEEDAAKKLKLAEDAAKICVLSTEEQDQILEALNTKATEIERRKHTMAHITRSSDADLAVVATQGIMLQRGNLQEDSVLNIVSHQEGQAVNDRNTAKHYLRGSNYTVIGKVDGILQDGRVVESKTRKNWFRVVPDYDIIQLQVYLRMLNAQEGLLVEASQQIQTPPLTRSTQVTPFSDEEWQAIDNELQRAAEEIHTATLTTVRIWANMTTEDIQMMGRRSSPPISIDIISQMWGETF